MPCRTIGRPAKRRHKLIIGWLLAALLSESVFLSVPFACWAQPVFLLQERVPFPEHRRAPGQEIYRQVWQVLEAEGRVVGRQDLDLRWQNLQWDLLGVKLPREDWRLDALALHLIAARRAFFRFDFVACLHRIRQAHGVVEERAPQIYVYPPAIYQLSLLQGVCHLALAESREAHDAFLQAVRLRPQEMPNTKTYAPEVVAAYERAKKQFLDDQAGRVGALSLGSMPAFAEVFWNGDYAGQTPLTLRQVPAGRHFLRFRLAGHGDWYGQVEVRTADLLRIEGTLHPVHLVSPRSANTDAAYVVMNHEAEESDQALQLLIAAGKVLDATELALLELRLAGENLQVMVERVDVKAERRLGQAVFHAANSVDGIQVLVAQIIGSLTKYYGSKAVTLPQPNLAMQPDKLPSAPSIFGGSSAPEDSSDSLASGAHARAHEPVQIGPKPWYQRHWVWVAAGVLLAGAAAGTALAMSSGNDSGGTGVIAGPPVTTSPGVIVGVSP